MAIVGLSALMGIWHAEDPGAKYLPPSLPMTAASDVQPHDSVTQQLPSSVLASPVLQQMESTLAQAGCPGWMVLASEGEAAFDKPAEPSLSHAAAANVKQTALPIVAPVSQVSYPAPVRVANRTLFAPPTLQANLAAEPASAADDLLDGMPDLLEEPGPAPASIKNPATDDNSAAEKETTSGPVALPSSGPITVPALVTPKPLAPPASVQQPAAELPPQTLPQQIEAQAPTGQLAPETLFVPPALPQVQQGSEALKAEPLPVAPIAEERLPRIPSVPHLTPLAAPPPAIPHSVDGSSARSATGQPAAKVQTYCEFVADAQYPSAQACAKCHEKIYDEWSVSSHAYATISPMFHKFEQKINDLSQGTIGYFCYRCHSPVGTTLGVSRAAPLWDLPLVAREGVTCIACHRVNQRYGKVNGERRIEPGDIHAPVYGSIGGGGIAEVIAQKGKYKVKTSPQEKGPGQAIHVAGERFDQLGKSEFCVSCHQVAVHPGIKLEVVWEQYRASPACKKGISCQDCHMGRIPGVKSGYEVGAAAKIGDKTINKQRKHANHVFYGPGYSIAHPGIFPHNIDANRWSMRDWLLFDWRGGWGTEEFEKLLEAGQIQATFPSVWAEVDDRYDAREIIEDNQKKLGAKQISRQQVMENGSHVDGPFFDTQLSRGQELKFHYVMTNTNDGHNLPSGSLGAQPQLWANVVLVGPGGQRLWESGYTDRWGDVADIHSEDVRNKLLPFDWQLFNLQTMFLISGVKGTDREFFLPVNLDIDQLAYLRPGSQPISVINHPPFIRMESRSLAPLGARKIPYQIPAHLMRQPGHYRLSFRLRSRAEPIYFMRFCGSTQEMNRAMNEGIVDFHQSSYEFFVR